MMCEQQDAVISMIAAVAENGVIGNGNQLPWRLSTDFRYFKSKTIGKPLIMGRKTFQSIGAPLPERQTIVISRNSDYSAEGIDVAVDLSSALECARCWAQRLAVDEIMICGGGEIYRHALPLAQRIYMTRVHCSPEGDAYFPDLSMDHWRIIEERFVEAGPHDNVAMTFLIYERWNAH